MTHSVLTTMIFTPSCLVDQNTIEIGLLGARGNSFEEAKVNQINLIETRILQIQKAFANIGIDITSITLP